MRNLEPGSVGAQQYEAVTDALLRVLPVHAPGISEHDVRTRVIGQLPEWLFPAGEGAASWLRVVQGDLAAGAVIVRERGNPARWHLA